MTVEMIEPTQPDKMDVALQTVQSGLANIHKIEAGLAELDKTHPANLVVDVTTPKGMAEAVAARRAWREPRVAVENARKAAKAPILELGRELDTFAAGLTKRLLEGEKNYDEQITVEVERKEALKREAAEKEAARVQGHKDRIALLFTSAAARLFGAPSAKIEERLQAIVAEPIAGFEEFEGDARAAQQAALDTLRPMLAEAQAREAEAERQRLLAEENARQQAELAVQREAFEREQKAARMQAEAQQRAAELAQAQREAAEREERRKVEDAQRAERERIAAEQKALDDAKRAEADRLAALERQRLDEEAAAERARLAQVAAEAAAAAEALRKQNEAKAEKERKRLSRELARADAVRQAGPRLLAALKVALAQEDGWMDVARDLIAEVEGAAE
jgi:hypothetical protein